MILLLCLLALLLYVLHSGIQLIRSAKKTNVTGPTPWPILGNGWLFLGDSMHFMKQLGNLQKKYENALCIHILSKRFVVMNDPETIEPIMSGMEYITKGDVYKFLTPWLGYGLLTSGGTRWKAHRKFLTPAFHFNILQSFLPIFLKNNVILVNQLNKIANGKSVDIFPIIALDTLDNIAESAMGVSIDAQIKSDSEYVKSIAHISEIVSLRMFNVLYAPDFLFNLFPIAKVHKKALNILHSHTNKVIADRLRLLNELNITLNNYDSEFGVKNKSPFLDLLLLSEIDGKKMDVEHVREEVDTFMFEGHDTTASCISFSLYCLSNHPDVQEKILAEQKSILGEDLLREPTFSDINQMKYLELVIKESLRLYPSVPLLAREATFDFETNGFFIPKDTNVTIDIYHMQRDPKYFDNPLEFHPERFDVRNNNSNGVNKIYSWIPFSAGPRNCIGQKFAMMEVKAVLSSIVKNFNLMPSGIEPMVANDLVLRSKNGVHVRMLPRNIQPN